MRFPWLFLYGSLSDWHMFVISLYGYLSCRHMFVLSVYRYVECWYKKFMLFMYGSVQLTVSVNKFSFEEKEFLRLPSPRKILKAISLFPAYFNLSFFQQYFNNIHL